MKRILSIVFILSQLSLFAQNENNHWMMGSFLGMKFKGGAQGFAPLVAKMYAPRVSATMSDRTTGDLLFYTNGRKIYNRQHQVMPNGGSLTGVDFDAHDVIAVPFMNNPARYHIFIVINTLPFTSNPDCNLFYAAVDMTLNGGLGDVIVRAKPIANWMDHHICVVKQEMNNGYWLITHKKGTSDFHVFPVSDDSVHVSNVRVSTTGGSTYLSNDFRYGSMSSDSKGSLIVHCYGKASEAAKVDLLGFDKVCGTLQLRRAIWPNITQFTPELAYAAFSPDDSKLYISWNYLSQKMSVDIYQYDMNTADPNTDKIIIGMLERAPGDIRAASDGRIYITRADNSNACAMLAGIIQPNKKGTDCAFNELLIDLAPGVPSPNFFVEYLPNFMTDKSTPGPGFKKPEIIVKGACLDEPLEVSLSSNPPVDSVKWDFGDNTIVKGQYKSSHQYSNPGSYNVCFTWYHCNVAYQICKTVQIGQRPVFSLGNDTTLCPGTPYTLNAEITGAKYLWSSGDTTSRITVKSPGKYSVAVSAGSCTESKSVHIKYYPSIWTVLGDEYFVCEKEKELVKLDAGEGFPLYKWIPTGDTTQWILVGSIGKYLVIVKDFRGCSGEDSTEVAERCPLRLFIPNAFSPNGDHHNDIFTAGGTGILSFRMTIYNRWGEIVYISTDLNKGWDGMIKGNEAPEGSYYYRITFSGYEGKRYRSKEQAGTFTLIR